MKDATGKDTSVTPDSPAWSSIWWAQQEIKHSPARSTPCTCKKERCHLQGQCIFHRWDVGRMKWVTNYSEETGALKKCPPKKSFSFIVLTSHISQELNNGTVCIKKQNQIISIVFNTVYINSKYNLLKMSCVQYLETRQNETKHFPITNNFHNLRKSVNALHSMNW